MKKLVVLLTLVATASAFSQGQVAFNNKVSSAGVDAPISYGPGGPVTAGARPQSTVNINGFGGANAWAGLYGGTPGTAEGQLTLLVPAVPFRSTTSAAGYVDTTYPGGTGTSTRTINGIAINSPGIFQIRAWDAGRTGFDSYEAAKAAIDASQGYYGVGNIISIANLGGGSIAPSQLVGAQGFAMTFVPEPSLIGLGLLGAVAGMVVFRRRR